MSTDTTTLTAAPTPRRLLYRFYWDCGRAGDIEGLFVSDEATVAAAMGKTADLGSCLGKHSEVSGELDTEAITVVTDDAAFIARFQELLPQGSGYNPLHYLPECR